MCIADLIVGGGIVIALVALAVHIFKEKTYEQEWRDKYFGKADQSTWRGK